LYTFLITPVHAAFSTNFVLDLVIQNVLAKSTNYEASHYIHKFPASVTSSLRSKYFQHPVVKYPLSSSLKVRYWVLYSYRTTGNITVLYSLIFIFLYRIQTKDSELNGRNLSLNLICS
jgi:hypothetical protein